MTASGESTKLSGIMRLVADAQTSKSRAQHLADRAARLLTAVAIGAGIVTFVVWFLVGEGVDVAVVRTVTVLVIACPHALGLAVPLVVAISTTLGARNGLLIRDRRGLEEARNVDMVVFDKTGTLTLGSHRVVAMHVADGGDEDEALRLAAAVEADSEHPIARGIVRSAEERGIDVPSAEGFRALSRYEGWPPTWMAPRPSSAVRRCSPSDRSRCPRPCKGRPTRPQTGARRRSTWYAEVA